MWAGRLNCNPNMVFDLTCSSNWLLCSMCGCVDNELQVRKGGCYCRSGNFCCKNILVVSLYHMSTVCFSSLSYVPTVVCNYECSSKLIWQFCSTLFWTSWVSTKPRNVPLRNFCGLEIFVVVLDPRPHPFCTLLFIQIKVGRGAFAQIFSSSCAYAPSLRFS